ncbi:unnamed protein product [Clonostachys chloroleuca]|uniref:Endosomal peripheral membrane protein n=1 Tax=Clonostachys chloroleuca TaxID=1926264 RepID=A0AA35LVL2_9HYPO|nr:unnamed protein product [Clonostachys chloroleuca]
MTTQLLATELANLIQESKRRHNDLRQAAEKSLEELKSLKNNSEQAAAEELSQRPNFVNPFIIACGTKNAKFTGIAIVCLQRLIVARALPRSKLNQVLEALMQATSAGLDVQLKILQALPSLLQNYASDLNGDLLVTALNICFTLQSSKNAIVTHTSAATLQQLVVSVFDKVVTEDKSGSDALLAGSAPTEDGTVELRPAALDAYRIFNDLCLLTDNQRAEFIRFSGISQTFGLELIESVITNHASVFASHPEQIHVLRVRAMPLIISTLRANPSFATSVRLVRILYTVLRKHITVLPDECGDALEILTQLLDHDSALWKRALCMEVYRGIFADHALLRRIFATYDARKGERDILKTLTATFVRLSTEKPSVIGLGHQSTLPISKSQGISDGSSDQAILEAGGVAGIITGSVGSESFNIGISTQWSSVRVPFIDQLDKTEPPTIPESYTYSLILTCLSSLSDGLAKFILPLTVPTESRTRRKVSTKADGSLDSPLPPELKAERAASFKKNPVPVNPLMLEGHPMLEEVKICAAMVDECWPAILATFSTFLYAALDSDYYHGLVRAFQRFAHVAGLLQLPTPRDAFLTTLGKSAVPPNVYTACLNTTQYRPSTPGTGPEGAAASFVSQARGLLSSDNLSVGSEKQRQGSSEAYPTSLTTRNLLCLRALLNLGIALGPTLASAWRIILESLQQADFVLYSTHKTPGRTPSVARGQDGSAEGDQSALTANFGHEVRAVETAASRLLESTIDFPNEPFVEVMSAICRLLERQPAEPTESTDEKPAPLSPRQSLPTPTGQHRRVMSFSMADSTGSTQEDQFALSKLGEIASINMERLLTFPPESSGWTLLIRELVELLNPIAREAIVRVRATETLMKLMLEAANLTTPILEESRGPIQLRIFDALTDALVPLRFETRDVSVTVHSTDIECHKIVLDGLKNILEECGENLISGWETAFGIIGSVFNPADSEINAQHASALTTRSSKLVRPSFNSLQLIASDFLDSLPNSCFLILVDTLYKFSSQHDDLNISLTTVTFFWVLSDFLSGKNKSLEITTDLVRDGNPSDLAKIAADPAHKGSSPALWMLLLLRLASVTSDERLELRNSAIQTLLRIFDAYGDRLTPEAWSICIKSVIFKLLSSFQEKIQETNDGEEHKNEHANWNGSAVVVLSGVANLLAGYLDVLIQHPSFQDLWRELLEHFTTLLDFEVLETNTAIFKALEHILSHTNGKDMPTLGKEPIDLAWDLWSRGVPVPPKAAQKGDNQACLVAYLEALNEVYRLIRSDLSVDRVRRILELLRQAVEEASVSSYVSDIEQVTQVQGLILNFIQTIRTDVDGVPSAVIKEVSGLVTLPFEQDSTPSVTGTRRTFVAMSKSGMQILETVILQHATQKDIYESGAFSAALVALGKPIELKYIFPIATKSTQPWRLATSTALSVLQATLKQLGSLEIPPETSQPVWTAVVAIADGIFSAEGLEMTSSAAQIADDEVFDIESFRKLRDLIIPSLGLGDVLEKSRKDYAESVFKTSIVHAPTPGDESILDKIKGGGLSALYTPRPGKTQFVHPNRRLRMSYVALDELFSLVSAEHDDGATEINGEASSALWVRMASTAAPFFIIRCALVLRAFIADQPLRGHMPQPLSQRKELLLVLTKLVALRSESEAIPALDGVESNNKKHLLRLYPLLVKAGAVSSDETVSGLLRKALEAVGEEFGL